MSEEMEIDMIEHKLLADFEYAYRWYNTLYFAQFDNEELLS